MSSIIYKTKCKLNSIHLPLAENKIHTAKLREVEKRIFTKKNIVNFTWCTYIVYAMYSVLMEQKKKKCQHVNFEYYINCTAGLWKIPLRQIYVF